jgi:hypothetical protein
VGGLGAAGLASVGMAGCGGGAGGGDEGLAFWNAAFREMITSP